MQLETLFATAIGITPPWKIAGLSFDSEKKRLDIKVTFERGATFEVKDEKSGETEQCKAYDTVEKTWRHLNFFEHECYLHARIPRVQLKTGGTKLISPPWSGISNGFTLLFEALILQMCKNMPVHQVGKLLKISDNKTWDMLEKYVNKALILQSLAEVDSIGVDETSLKKGHNYISLFVDLAEKRTLFVTEGKDHSTVTDFAEFLTACGGKTANIQDVSCDMSPAFIKGIKQELPNAQITFDKFHILKIINEAVDAVRREEAKTTPQLKGARYAFIKNEENLTQKQKDKKESLSQLNLKSMRALHLRENFQAIYAADTLEQFEKRLKQWYFWATHCRLEPMKKAAKMIKNHWDGVLRWQESQINNGILEGLNSVIQAAKRKARGYKFDHFKVIALLLTGKLNFQALNPVLPTRF